MEEIQNNNLTPKNALGFTTKLHTTTEIKLIVYGRQKKNEVSTT
jgi:hypothetical protein